jgi:hypothetical protein
MRMKHSVPAAGENLAPSAALNLAMELGVSFQVAIQQADSKIAMLLIVHPGTSLLVIGQAGNVVHGLGADLLSLARLVTAALFVVGFVLAGRQVVLAFGPRSAPSFDRNHFSFPSVSSQDVPPLLNADIEELAVEAWAHTRLLADIASLKNRHIRAAVRWLVLMITAGAAVLAESYGQ